MLRRDSSYEGDSEESEDEDEIDEDLLQELVDERNVLIAELEEENMKQVKQIEALTEKINDFKVFMMIFDYFENQQYHFLCKFY